MNLGVIIIAHSPLSVNYTVGIRWTIVAFLNLYHFFHWEYFYKQIFPILGFRFKVQVFDEKKKYKLEQIIICFPKKSDKKTAVT